MAAVLLPPASDTQTSFELLTIVHLLICRGISHYFTPVRRFI